MEHKQKTKIATAILVVARKYGFDHIKLARAVAKGHGLGYRLFLAQMETAK